MLLEVWHLEGGERGRAETLRGPVVTVGSDAGVDLWLGHAAGVLPLHAEIVFHGGKVYLRPKGAVRLNGRPVGEVTLRDGDLLDLGDEVHLRLRLVTEEADRVKEFQALLGRTPGPARGAHVPLSPGRLLHGRAGAAATLLFLAILVGGAYLAADAEPREKVEVRLTRERNRQDRLRTQQQRSYEDRMRTLRGELSDLKGRVANRADVDARVGEVQRAVAEIESSVLRRVSSEIETTIGDRPELKEARAALERIANQDAAAERIISTYAGSICLIQGSYGFGRMVDGKWAFLREASPELLDETGSDKVPLSIEGDGPLFKIEYTGTGFLAGGKGVVLTNRHIAEPWWHNEAAEPLVEGGFEPRFFHLRAYFPGRKKSYEFDLSRTILSDDADLAALRFTPDEEFAPPLALADPRRVIAGRRVLLLGYPSGLDALIARTGEEFARSLMSGGGLKPAAVLDQLAARGFVRPLPTQGHLSDVIEDKVLFDAPTAVGGSGGPLVDMDGKVVAINYGILKAFSGANFGVPVAYAHRLLEKTASAPGTR